MLFPCTAVPMVPKNMTNSVKSSLLLLLFLGVLISMPIVGLGLAVHDDITLGLIAEVLIIVFVFLGPLSFFFTDPTATDLERILVAVIGATLFLAWLRALGRKSRRTVPYLPVMGWALIGAYFCVSQVFVHIT